MNWNSGSGVYEYEQYYTAYANHNYSTSKVNYVKFNPTISGVKMGCGIRKKPGEESLLLADGIIISSGKEKIRDPENIDDREDKVIDFVGKAIVVKDVYKPKYQFVEAHEGNHAIKVTPDENRSYEYMIFAAWSEGAVLNTKEKFETYVKNTAIEYNNPIQTKSGQIEIKGINK